jgi:hypothetical protein
VLLAPTAGVAALFLSAALLVRPLLPAAYRSEPEALLGIVTTLLWVGVVAAPVVTFVKALVLGTVAWATLVIMGTQAPFRVVVRTILVGECILAAQGLFIAVILRARGAEALRSPEDLMVATGLDAFIDGEGPVLAALARGVTPFHAAWVVFLTLALARGAHTSRVRGGAAALCVWGLVAGVGALRALVA